jgi:hypothetical protein
MELEGESTGGCLDGREKGRRDVLEYEDFVIT